MSRYSRAWFVVDVDARLSTTLRAQDKPVMMEEGMMTLLRKNVVSNSRLIKCADQRGLRVSGVEWSGVRRCGLAWSTDAAFLKRHLLFVALGLLARSLLYVINEVFILAFILALPSTSGQRKGRTS